MILLEDKILRAKITDNNIFPNFSLEDEYDKLNTLWYDRTAFGRMLQLGARTRPSMSYNDCLQALFLNWKLRGTFTTVEEMLFGLNISVDDFCNDVSEERMLDYIQFILNAVDFIDSEIDSQRYSIYSANDGIGKAIIKNSKLIVDKVGAEIKKEKKEFFIIYKDDIATAVVEQHKDISNSIGDYLKIDNKRDLQRKGEILCTLAKKLEPYEKSLNNTELGKLCSDTTFLLNYIGARHSLNPKNKIEAKFIEMNNEELEEWYDKTFKMFLACMAVLPYLDIKDEIKEIKQA